MGSRRIQAMAQLIDRLDDMARSHPCAEVEPCLPCQVAFAIESYRQQFIPRKARSAPEPKAEGPIP